MSPPPPLPKTSQALAWSRIGPARWTRSWRVFVIDDDSAVLRALELASAGERLSRGSVLDARGLSGTAPVRRRRVSAPRPEYAKVANGLDVQEAMTREGIPHPIIFFSGQGDVPTTAQAMRMARSTSWSSRSMSRTPGGARARRQPCAGPPRAATVRARHRGAPGEAHETLEREVCDSVARGLLNKQIAFELGTAEKTVKVHRGRVMRKLELDSVADLVRLLSKLPAKKSH